MKHVINILVILLLTGFAIGIAYLVKTETSEHNAWAFLYVPWCIMALLWGCKLDRDY